MKKQCNFCGRSERDVKLLITGVNGYICEDCATQAYRIVQETMAQQTEVKKNAKAKNTKIPKPREIKDYLDQ